MSTDIAKKDLTMSERFMNKVVAEFTGGVGEVALELGKLPLQPSKNDWPRIILFHWMQP